MLFDRSRGEFFVNSGLYANQSQARVTLLSDGGFLATWHTASAAGPGVHESIRVQRFGATGQKVGPETYLNTLLPSGTTVAAPDAVALSDGGYAVAWVKTVNGAREFRLASFNADGSVRTAEAMVPALPFSNPALAALSGGGFVLAWHRLSALEVLRYDDGGVPIGSTILVDNGGFYSTSVAPAVAGLAGGRFVVAWSEGPNSADVKARVYAADGSAVGAEFTINAGTLGTQSQPSVTALAGGGFVVAWQSIGFDSYDIYARTFDSAGNALGPDLLVNSAVPGDQTGADVTALAGGGFLVAWTDNATAREGGTGGSSAAIVGQAFDAAGARVGGEFLINSTIQGEQSSPSLIALPSGEVVVIWTDGSASQQTFGSDIRGQMFKPHSGITDIATTATGVSEVAFVGSQVGTFSSNAAVNGGVTYQLVGDTSGGALRLVGNRLVVDRNVLLDYETATSVKVTIRATEAGGISYDEQFTLNVLNSVGELRYAPGDAYTWSSPASFAADGALVTRLSTGDYLAVVRERSTAGTTTRADVLDEAGQRIGASMALDGPGPVAADALVALGDGGFALAWTVQNGYKPDFQTAPREDVMMRRYDAAGHPLGDAVMVNTTVVGSQYHPNMAMLADGSLLVAWYDGQPSGGQQPIPSLRGQLFAPSGERIGGEFVIADGFPVIGSTIGFDVAALPGGGFLATWDDIGTASPNYNEIRLQFFDNLGNKVGGESQVNTALRSSQSEPSVAMLATGGFVISWTDRSNSGGDFSSAGIKAQLFDAAGNRVGGEFLVNTVTHYPQAQSEAVALPTGGFIISWADYSTGTGSMDLEYLDIKAQLFTSNGTRVGDEFQINPLSQGTQFPPALAAGPSGSFIALWGDSALAANATSARVYRMIMPGSAAADLLVGTAGFDIIEALAGDDDLDGGAGADVMRGGAGNDVYHVDDAGDVVEEKSSEGVDAVRTSLAGYSLFGTQIETLIATSGIAHEFRGSAADNLLAGGAANDFLLLQDGGEDMALGGDGNDVLYFGTALSPGDVADGGEGRDALVLQGNVTVTLGDANLVGIESLSIQSGANTRFGDTANNFYDFDVTTADGNVAAGLQLIVNAQSLRSGEDFTFDGSAETDGRFLVYGGHGVDDLTGGDGVDVFFFEGQRWGPDDRVDGGDGRDSLVISAGSGLTHIEFGPDSFTSIESISVNNRYATDPSQKPSYELVLHSGNVAAGATLIVNGSSIPLGQVANIDGRSVHDGNLILFGGGGHDRLAGGGGADLIVGGGGADALTGGPGADIFRYDAATDSLAGATDLIGDFATGTDKIDLSRIDADTGVAGDQAFAWIGADAFSGAAGELRVFDDNGYQRVEGDTNGDGVADLVILLQTGTAPLVQGDFLP